MEVRGPALKFVPHFLCPSPPICNSTGRALPSVVPRATEGVEMTTYVYSAVDAGGKAAQGAMEAANQQEALERIRDMGFFPMKLTEKTPSTSPAERARR